MGTLNGLDGNEEKDDGIGVKVATAIARVVADTFVIMQIGAVQ